MPSILFSHNAYGAAVPVRLAMVNNYAAHWPSSKKRFAYIIYLGENINTESRADQTEKYTICEGRTYVVLYA